jgi:DNA polymerase-4
MLLNDGEKVNRRKTLSSPSGVTALPPGSMQTVRWLFLDLNSYFASVEQEMRPELRNKPVAVVPMMADTTVCIAASYEAKMLGVKTGTRVSEAKRLCPGLQLVKARHAEYVRYHNRIVEAIESCIPVEAVMSIDEVACKLTGSQQQIEIATELSHKIKQTIRQRVGSTLRCSIGLGPNRFLSKVASDMQKPDGFTVIRQSDLPEILFSLKLSDFPGIGRHMEERLRKAGINSTKRLLELSKVEMRKAWGGIVGERFWCLLRGEEVGNLETHRSTVGHSHVLPPKMRSREQALLVAQKLVHKAAVRLRRMEYWADHLGLHVRFIGKKAWGAQLRVPESQDTQTFLQALQLLWKNVPEGKLLAVGVALFGLTPDGLHNYSLFDEAKRTRLAKAMDRINRKFGSETVHFGDFNAIKGSAPTRIAFTQIPDPEDLEDKSHGGWTEWMK